MRLQHGYSQAEENSMCNIYASLQTPSQHCSTCQDQAQTKSHRIIPKVECFTYFPQESPLPWCRPSGKEGWRSTKNSEECSSTLINPCCYLRDRWRLLHGAFSSQDELSFWQQGRLPKQRSFPQRGLKATPGQVSLCYETDSHPTSNETAWSRERRWSDRCT